jgi:hypothetical protein
MNSTAEVEKAPQGLISGRGKREGAERGGGVLGAMLGEPPLSMVS